MSRQMANGETVSPTCAGRRLSHGKARPQQRVVVNPLSKVDSPSAGPTPRPSQTRTPVSPATPMTFFQALLPQLDGPQDYRPRMVPSTTPHAAAPARGSGTSAHLPKTAYRDLLPYCTTEMPLNEQQVIGLSDVAGSLKEVMLLALRARMDERCAEELVMAVGEDAMRGIVDFFGDEFEI